MAYNINIIKPNSSYRIARLGTLYTARAYLSEVLRSYRNDMPRGSKRLCKWVDKDTIHVRDVHNDGRVSGDTHYIKIIR